MKLADRYIPAPEFSETHSIVVAAPRAVTWKALSSTSDPSESGPARALFAVRALIGRALHGSGSTGVAPSEAFIRLDEVPGVEFVEGVVGQWWRFGASDARRDVSTTADFLAFDEPGYAKGTFGVVLEELGPDRTRVVTETRVVTTDAAAHRWMARYWLLIRAGSGLIRRVMLSRIRRRALALDKAERAGVAR